MVDMWGKVTRGDGDILVMQQQFGTDLATSCEPWEPVANRHRNGGTTTRLISVFCLLVVMMILLLMFAGWLEC